jgi:uncharacterized protein YdeI (BOF family)
MKKFILACSALCVMLGIASPSLADKNDPDSNKWKIASVRWIRDHAESDHKDIDDKYLVVIGRITDKIDEDTYRLDDGTGAILIEVDEDEIADLPVGQRVVIRGKVDEAYWDIGELELNVESWRPERKS